jgi:flagellar basal body-associated protein FliL
MITILSSDIVTIIINILFIVVAAALIAGFIYRVRKAAKSKSKKGESTESTAKRYAGKALMTFDPITGAPINVVDKAAVVEYIEEHFVEGQNDETGIYGKEKDDF